MNRLIYEEIVALLVGSTVAHGFDIVGGRRTFGVKQWGFRYTYAHAMIDKFRALRNLCSTRSTPY